MIHWLKKKFGVATAQAANHTMAPDTKKTTTKQPDAPHQNTSHKTRGDQLFEQGKLTDATDAYLLAISINPDHAEARVNLGNVLREQGRHEEAEYRYKQAIVINPELFAAYYNLGSMLLEQDRPDEAIGHFQRALHLKSNVEIVYRDLCYALFKSGQIEAAKEVVVNGLKINPHIAVFHAFLGNLHYQQKNPEEAIVCYQKALQIQPGLAEVYTNLGKIYQEAEKLDEAIFSFQKALAFGPGNAELHFDLGLVFQKQEKLEVSIECYRAALAMRPNFAQTHFALGTALQAQGKLHEAITCYREAIRIEIDYSDAHCNLGAALYETGRMEEAIVSYQRALQRTEKHEYKTGFCRCIEKMRFIREIPDIRPMVLRALSEAWIAPDRLIATALSIVKLNPDIKSCIDHAASVWPARISGQELFGASGLTAIANDLLLRCLLENTHNSNLEMERFLTLCRFAMLETVMPENYSGKTENAAAEESDENVLNFYCAIAQQCFVVEYVFDHTVGEYKRAQALRDQLTAALESDKSISALKLIAVAAYFPLYALPFHEKLLVLSDLGPARNLLTQQVREPMEELQLRVSIPRLTAISDGVSAQVQRQYEENPYPRWVKVAPGNSSTTVDAFLRRQFPHVPFEPLGNCNQADILIAGCGTGQHPIGTTQQFCNANVLAIDLSLSSLAYAKRKAQELRLDNLQFAHADIMNLETINRRFDVIESVGVLHHMADPMSGWQILLSLLRPGGFMCLGLYSDLARREVVAARELIAERGYGSSAQDIRDCRQDIMSAENRNKFVKLILSPDFYGMSKCRDLIFHVQEHRFNLCQLKASIAKLGLDFIGFTLHSDIVKRYSSRFPDDKLKKNLDYWNIFEAENQNTFAGMYEFWVQKRR